MKNLFTDIPDKLLNELLETLVRTDAVQVQRIVSRGHTTAESTSYSCLYS